MDLARQRKTSDYYGRYYTDQIVASVLVDAVDAQRVESVIDLGAGEGALLSEARRRWDQARLIAVDIDSKANIFNADKLVRGMQACIADALSEDIDTKIGLSFGSVDLALCNPPYVQARWREHFSEIMEDAGLSGVFSKIKSTPSEVLFVAQNIRFLKSGGALALILPDGLVSGEKYVGFRKILAEKHGLSYVIELPRRVFKKTDAKAHVVLIKKDSGASNGVGIQSLLLDGSLSRAVHVSPESAIHRLDYSYHHANLGIRDSSFILRDVVVSIRRGRISSAQLHLYRWPVLHTTDLYEGLDAVPEHCVIAASGCHSGGEILAEAGDVLISRVGRNLETKIVMVERGGVLISDCIFAVKIKPEYRASVFAYLKSALGRAALKGISRGVGAKYITVSSLLGLPLPVTR